MHIGGFLKQIEYKDARITPELIAIYGPPGAGKTQLACALPWGSPRWGEKAAYLAIDPRSAGLKSVRQEDRDHILVFQPEVKLVGGKKVIDMNGEVTSFLTGDWSKTPEVRTLILDTISVGADSVLDAVASSGAFSDKHITYGVGNAMLSIPMQGDYGATQNVVKKWFRMAEQLDMNILALFHGDVVESDAGEHPTAWGGPTTVGKAGVRDMSRKFENLFFCSNRAVNVPAANGKPATKELRFEVYTQKKGVWEAKLRCGGVNPMPVTDITGNPRFFWEQFDKVTGEN
jgi:hypothetical protein